MIDIDRTNIDRDIELLKDLSESELKQWMHHPVSALFFRYLGLVADNYRIGHLQDWESGVVDEKQERELVGRLAMIRDLQGLTLNAMRRLYGLPEESKEAPSVRDSS